ncbi:MAG: FAD:protein FMN transferase [Propionibacteriaceae bacterium]|nr:FAD:protein FMN transferase [Propionibacteriaceae bacterium]
MTTIVGPNLELGTTGFAACGTWVTIELQAPAVERLLARARRLVEQLEGLLSRFRPDSDVSRLRAAAPGWVEVSPDCDTVLAAARRGQRLTGGAFDPCALDCRVLDSRARPGGGARPAGGPWPSRPAPEPGGQRRWRLPAGARLDLGGIAKGHIADRVRALCQSQGAVSGLVSLGTSSIALWGGAARGQSWRVGVRDPGPAPVAAGRVGAPGPTPTSAETVTGREGRVRAGAPAAGRTPVGGDGSGRDGASALAPTGWNGRVRAGVSAAGWTPVGGDGSGRDGAPASGRSERGRALGVIELDEGALSTSGGDERGGHVVDPRSGAPAAGCLQAVVWARRAVWAEVWATALLVLGCPGLVEHHGPAGFEALLVTGETVVASGGLSGFQPFGWERLGIEVANGLG